MTTERQQRSPFCSNVCTCRTALDLSTFDIAFYIYIYMYTTYIPYYTIHEFIYVADDGAAGPGTSTTTGATTRLPRDSTSMLLGPSASSSPS